MEETNWRAKTPTKHNEFGLVRLISRTFERKQHLLSIREGIQPCTSLTACICEFLDTEEGSCPSTMLRLLSELSSAHLSESDFRSLAQAGATPVPFISTTVDVSNTKHSKTLALKSYWHNYDLFADLLQDMFLWDKHRHLDKLFQNMRHWHIDEFVYRRIICFKRLS